MNLETQVSQIRELVLDTLRIQTSSLIKTAFSVCESISIPKDVLVPTDWTNNGKYYPHTVKAYVPGKAGFESLVFTHDGLLIQTIDSGIYASSRYLVLDTSLDALSGPITVVFFRKHIQLERYPITSNNGILTTVIPSEIEFDNLVLFHNDTVVETTYLNDGSKLIVRPSIAIDPVNSYIIDKRSFFITRISPPEDNNTIILPFKPDHLLVWANDGLYEHFIVKELNGKFFIQFTQPLDPDVTTVTILHTGARIYDTETELSDYARYGIFANNTPNVDSALQKAAFFTAGHRFFPVVASAVADKAIHVSNCYFTKPFKLYMANHQLPSPAYTVNDSSLVKSVAKSLNLPIETVTVDSYIANNNLKQQTFLNEETRFVPIKFTHRINGLLEYADLDQVTAYFANTGLVMEFDNTTRN